MTSVQISRLGSAVVSVLAGGLFGVGLTLAAMVNPHKVLNFLNLFGHWDPSLALVMGGGVAVTLVSFRWVLGREKPVVAEQFSLPTRLTIDRKLVIGSVLFGVGWGLAGYCPGPAIAALGFGSTEPWLFVAAMFLGSFCYQRLAD